MHLVVILLVTVIESIFQQPLEVDKHVNNQILFYVENIESEINIDANVWALNEIAFTNCKTLSLVQKLSSRLPKYSDFYSQISCSKNSNFSISKEREKSIWIQSDQKLLSNIVSKELVITDSILKKSSSPHIHLTLLMNRDFSKYYSKEYLKKAQSYWIKRSKNPDLKETLEHSLILSNIIWSSYILDDYEKIREYSEAFKATKFQPTSQRLLRLLSALDYTYYLFGKFDKSLDLQRNKSLPIAKFIGHQDEINKIKERQGAYLYELGKYKSSLKIYESLYSSLDKGDSNYTLFNNLSINYYKLGNIKKYLNLQLSALDENIDSYESLLKIYRNLFIYYTSIKDFTTATNYINKAKEIALTNNDETELALIDSFLGTFYWNSYKDHQTAIRYLKTAENRLSPETNSIKFIQLLLEKGTIYAQIDSLDQAYKAIKKAESLALKKSNTVYYIDALINLADINIKKNALGKAQNNLKEVSQYLLEDFEFKLLVKYYSTSAKYLQLSGQEERAIQKLKPVTHQIIERSKNNTDSQAGYWSVEEEYMEAFDLIIELYIDNGKYQEALFLLDQFKTINDASLYNNPLVKASKLTEEELAEEKKLNQKLQQLRKDFLNADSDKRFALSAEIDRTSAARDQILAKSHLAKAQKLPPMWTIQRSIANNELLLHFTEIGQNLYVGYLTNDEIRVKKFSFGSPIQELFEQVGDELASGATNLVHLHRLYEILELNDISDHIQQLTVVPDNALYRIPLEVIPIQPPNSAVSFGSTRYMIEDYRFRYFTSLHEYATNRRSFQKKLNTDFSGFAISNFSNFHSTNLPSLPFATVETKNIATELSALGEKNIYEGETATKQAFKNNMKSSRLLHVATHSEVSDQDPLFSTIYLNNGLKTADTLQSEQALYAYELFDTPLNSEFVMLNSCSSGSGKFIQGSGIIGISRALRYAGAKSLALNLWSVNDKVAAGFATDFYQSLNEGSTKSDAIRLAKLNQLKKANANPHFWGAYMMIGNPAPITNKTAHPWILYALLSLGTAGLSYLSHKKAA